MRHPRKRRPRRAWTWWGCVTEVYPETVWATLALDSSRTPIDLCAEFDRSLFDDDVQEGTIFTLYAYRRGKKTRTVLRQWRRTWTAEEIAEVEANAARRLAELNPLMEAAR